jgi:hypothetical protein
MRHSILSGMLLVEGVLAFCALGFELGVARRVAPYVGMSTDTWTAIIAPSLAPGRWAMRSAAGSQLRLARSLGLRVPRSIITNEPQHAEAFFRSCPAGVICKPVLMGSHHVGGEHRVAYTRPVPPGVFAALRASIALCPTYLQEAIPKDHELRVALIGDRLLCCRIDSQVVPGAEQDWRAVDTAALPHAIVPLPDAIHRALRAYLAAGGPRGGRSPGRRRARGSPRRLCRAHRRAGEQAHQDRARRRRPEARAPRGAALPRPAALERRCLGAANADLLYRLGQDGWSEIETENWRATLRQRLPADLEIRHLVAFDFAEMTGTVQLWRSDDAECCPRGGMVALHFAIAGPGLVLTGLARRPP